MKEPRIPAARTPADRSLDLRRVKVAISEQQKDAGGSAASNRRGLSASTASAPGTAGGQQVKKLLPVKPKSDPLERKNPHDVKQQVASGAATTAVALDSSVAARPRSWPNKLEVSRLFEDQLKVLSIRYLVSSLLSFHLNLQISRLNRDIWSRLETSPCQRIRFNRRITNELWFNREEK